MIDRANVARVSFVNTPVNLYPKSLIYLQKKKLDGFYFSVISWYLRSPTYHTKLFIALVYVHHTHLFSTRLSFQNSLHATETCFCMFCTCSVMH